MTKTMVQIAAGEVVRSLDGAPLRVAGMRPEDLAVGALLAQSLAAMRPRQPRDAILVWRHAPALLEAAKGGAVWEAEDDILDVLREALKQNPLGLTAMVMGQLWAIVGPAEAGEGVANGD